MLDLKLVRENLPAVAAALKKRGFDFDVEAFERVEAGRRTAITEAEQLKAAKNGLSKKIGELKKAGEDAGELMDRVRLMGQQVSAA
ncbi:MAG TPA: serine--tRNA ligase, partial [bacterium]|nr:serine--tRNA ligase [bacterium]